MPVTLTPEDLGTILSVWAHPDDETYLAAAVMAAARAHGQRVVCVIASAGERGTVDPEAWSPERLGRVRRWEAQAAMAILGVPEHHILDLPDGSLAQHASRGRARIGELLDEVRPETVLTFGHEGMTFHPDHIAVHEWVTEEWRQRGSPCRLLYAVTSVPAAERSGAIFEELGAFMTDQRPAAVPVDQLALMVHPTGTALDQKIAALAAMSTQTATILSAFGWDGYATHAAEEAYVEANRAGPGEA